MRRRLCSIADLVVGEPNTFAIDGVVEPILVVYDGQQIFATSSTCPHEFIPLVLGKFKKGRIECPGHSYQFDLSTGKCTHDPSLSLVRYAVSIENNDVWIETLPLFSSTP